MLPGALLLLEPLEYPPPYPPPLALAKDKVGSPIRAITIIAAMSFVGFNVRVLSMDVAGRSSSVILAEVVPGKPKIREPPTEECYLFFWLNETINGPSKFACFPLLEGRSCWSKCGRRTRPFSGRAFREHRTNVGVLPSPSIFVFS